MRRVYALLADNTNLECPARVSTHMLKNVDSEADVVVLTPFDIHIVVPLAIVKRVHYASFKGSGHYRNTFMKLRAMELFEYDRAVMIDLDVVVWSSPKHLFFLPIPNHTVAAPRAYWLPQPFMSSGGPVVFTPSRMLAKRAFHALDGKYRRYFPGEMDWFNEEFARDVVYLSGIYSLLNGEFVPNDGIFRYWGRKMHASSSDVLERSTFIHCIAGWKPWVKHPYVNTTEMKLIYSAWYRTQTNVCRKSPKRLFW